ncbi:hypothetical protein ACKRZS_012648 [Fusarium odoratissimum]
MESLKAESLKHTIENTIIDPGKVGQIIGEENDHPTPSRTASTNSLDDAPKLTGFKLVVKIAVSKILDSVPIVLGNAPKHRRELGQVRRMLSRQRKKTYRDAAENVVLTIDATSTLATASTSTENVAVDRRHAADTGHIVDSGEANLFVILVVGQNLGDQTDGSRGG